MDVDASADVEMEVGAMDNTGGSNNNGSTSEYPAPPLPATEQPAAPAAPTQPPPQPSQRAAPALDLSGLPAAAVKRVGELQQKIARVAARDRSKTWYSVEEDLLKLLREFAVPYPQIEAVRNLLRKPLYLSTWESSLPLTANV
jgi:hypothetical protein